MSNKTHSPVKALIAIAFYGALIITLPTGCKPASVTDQINADLESATTIASMEERQNAWNQAIQKHFPVGMKVEQANVLLKILKNDGFLIEVYETDGFRNWPAGPLNLYPKELAEQAKHELTGKEKIVAIKKWNTRLIVEEHIGIILVISKQNKTIIESRANRSSTLL